VRRFRSAGTIVPVLLAVVGIGLIIAGQLDLGRPPSSSLPPIPLPTRTPVAIVSPSGTGEASGTATASPSPTFGSTATAVQLEIRSVGINVNVFESGSAANDDDPGLQGAYILRSSSQPGRGTNSYIFAHARNVPVPLFKNLWNVQVGAEVRILMSDGGVLVYRVTEVHPNVSCPDDRAPPMPPDVEPLALKYAAGDCSEGSAWTQPTDHERLTMQTSQGFNRNWGELIVVADPVTSS
jgi:hypothetical protein